MARCVAAAELGCTIEEKRILAGQTVPERSAQIGKSLLSLWQSRIEIRWGLSCRCHAACTSVPTNILFSAVSRQAPLAARSIGFFLSRMSSWSRSFSRANMSGIDFLYNQEPCNRNPPLSSHKIAQKSARRLVSRRVLSVYNISQFFQINIS